MPEYARVCRSMPEYARVCQSMPEYARVCQSMPEYVRVCKSMPEYDRVCHSMPECARVYSCNGSESESPVLRTGVIWKSGVVLVISNRSGWLKELLTELKMAIILPTGQWYAPSAVINDAWFFKVVSWFFMVFEGF